MQRLHRSCPGSQWSCLPSTPPPAAGATCPSLWAIAYTPWQDYDGYQHLKCALLEAEEQNVPLQPPVSTYPMA